MDCGSDHVVVNEKKMKLKLSAFTVGKPAHIIISTVTSSSANIQIRHVDVS